MGDHDRPGIGAELLLKLFVPQNAPGIRLHEIQLHTVFLQAVQRAKNRIVFTYCGEHMISRVKQPAESHIQALGRVGRKCNAGWVVGSQQFCQRSAGLVDQPRRVKGRLVRPPARISGGLQGVQHGLPDRTRLLEGRCRIVKIDHKLSGRLTA